MVAFLGDSPDVLSEAVLGTSYQPERGFTEKVIVRPQQRVDARMHVCRFEETGGAAVCRDAEASRIRFVSKDG